MQQEDIPGPMDQHAPADAASVGIVVEKRRIGHPWQEWQWRATQALAGAPQIARWITISQTGDCIQYHAATVRVELHRKETESYLYNLASPQPSLFVVMREPDHDDEDGDDERPHVHLVTASVFEAQDYLDSGEEMVDAVPLPDVLARWLQAFVDAHHVEEKFIKRKRDKLKPDDRNFGKRPVSGRAGRTGAPPREDG